MSSAARTCRVLTHCTIGGQSCIAGDRVELTEPERSFLIAHRQVVLVDEPNPAKKKREEGERGPPI